MILLMVLIVGFFVLTEDCTADECSDEFVDGVGMVCVPH